MTTAQRPSDYIYAKFSQQVYYPGGMESPHSLPKGWRVLQYVDQSKEDNYAGAAYTDGTHIIIAHRGTEFPEGSKHQAPPPKPQSTYQSITGGLKHFFGTLSSSSKDASAWIKMVMRLTMISQQISAYKFSLEIKSAHPDLPISFCGHGLGAL